jgi:hypothetical protein
MRTSQQITVICLHRHCRKINNFYNNDMVCKEEARWANSYFKKKFPLVPDGFRPIAVSEQSKKIE